MTKQVNIQLTELDLLDLIFTRYCARNLFNLKRRIKELGFSEDLISYLESAEAIEMIIEGSDEFSTHFMRMEYRREKATLLDGSQKWTFEFKNNTHDNTDTTTTRTSEEE